MTPETERRFVDLVVGRGLAPAPLLQRLGRERAGAPGRRQTLPWLLCDAGVMKSAQARLLLKEVRARAVPPTVRETVLLHEPKSETLEGPPQQLAAPAPRRDESSGDLVEGAQLGPYRIEAILGRGGMGVVYRARDIRLGRAVALKTISGAADRDAVERFVREARAAARLKHPGVVPVFEVGAHQGIRFMALELVEGPTLAGHLRAAGPLEPTKAAALVRELARAVHFAHGQGILHRDLKPGNVLLDRDGRPRLTDFGLARDSQAKELTNTGDVLGTPAYMAPEQARGDNRQLSAATVVWGLGAILYEALAGQPPFSGATGLEVLRKVESDEPEAPGVVRARKGKGRVTANIETIALKCLEKDTALRYATAAALAEDLDHFVAGKPIAARPRSLAEDVSPRAFARGRLAELARASLTLVILCSFVSPYVVEAWWWQSLHDRGVLALLLVNGVVPAIVVSLWIAWRFLASRVSAARRSYVLVLVVCLAAALVSGAAAVAAAAAADAAAAAAAAAGDRPAPRARLAHAADERQATDLSSWTRRGLHRLEEGDTQGALTDLEQATRIAPDAPSSAEAFEGLGRVRLARHERDAAIAALGRAIALDARRAGAWRLRALARFEKGDLDGALADLETLVTRARFDRELWDEWRVRLEGAAQKAPPERARRIEALLAKVE